MSDVVSTIRVWLGKQPLDGYRSYHEVLLGNAADEIELLREALHAAIMTPRGIVPTCAEPFYDPRHPALSREWSGWPWRLDSEDAGTDDDR